MGSNEVPASGSLFTLGRLLGGEIQLVIPDMQRDYCWGSTEADGSSPKAPVFVRSLISLFTEGRTTPLGLLYGYELPEGSSHIHIIDGQQRVTTLYLLLGMLYRRTPTLELRRLLISDYELIDDREPRLLYQARSEAMYFLSDLVTNFFLNRDGRLSELEKRPWYHNIYNADPTVQSFISALRLIDKELEDAARRPGWDFADFARYVAEKLAFMYHDLGSRPQAERMFITINTTGQPLTDPQRYKASMIAAYVGDRHSGSRRNTDSDLGKAVDRWEQMEQWAWAYRSKVGASTSDAMLERILNLYAAHVREDGDVQLSKFRFDSLYQFFCNYRELVEYVPEALDFPGMSVESSRESSKSLEQLFMVLPTVKYIKRWNYATNHGEVPKERVREFWNFLHFISQYQKVSSSRSDLQAAYTVVEKLPRPDLTTLLDAGVTGLPERLINAEERAKLNFLAHNGDRKRAYALLLKAQEHPLLSGRAKGIISWCKRKDNAYDLNAFARYVEAIYEVWGDDISRREDLDVLRRALLTLRHRGFPIVRRGETSLSLCWQDYDWQRLMVMSPGVVKQLLDKVISAKIPAIETLRKMADTFADRAYPYYFLIREPKTLVQVENRMLLRPSEPFLGFYVASDNGRHTSTRWYVEQMLVHPYSSSWAPIRTYGTRCIYTDHRRLNLAIDLYYTPDDRWRYRIEVFSRPDAPTSREARPDIPDMIRILGYPMRYDKKRKRCLTGFNDAKSALKMIDQIMKICDE